MWKALFEHPTYLALQLGQVNNAFPSIDFRFVFINDFKISSFFLESKIKFLTKFALKYAISLLVLAVMLSTWDAQIELSTSV